MAVPERVPPGATINSWWGARPSLLSDGGPEPCRGV